MTLIPTDLNAITVAATFLSLLTGLTTGGCIVAATQTDEKQSHYVLGFAAGTYGIIILTHYSIQYHNAALVGFLIALPWKTALTQKLPIVLPSKRTLAKPVKPIGYALKCALFHW